MAKTLLIKYRDSGGSAVQNQGLTRYYWTGNANFSANTTEANRQVTWRAGGTLSNFLANITANSLNVTCTWRTRANGGNGSQSLSITAAATGVFEDTSNTDSVTAGDEINYQQVTPSGSGSITTQVLSILFDATSNTVGKHGGGAFASTFNSGTEFTALAPCDANVTSEAETAIDCNTAGTAKNLYVFVEANTRTTDATTIFRIGSSSSALALTVGAGLTGVFENTSDTASVAENDDINFATTLGSGGNSITRSMFIDFETTNSKFVSSISAITGRTTNANVTTYVGLGGQLGAVTTEASARTQLNIGATVSNIFIYLSANSVTAASTFSARQDSTDTSVSASIMASTTGQFEDASNSEALVAADLINARIVTGATGTSITVRVAAIMFENTDSAAVTPEPEPVYRPHIIFHR